jgi:hypothetical protein
LVVADRQFLTGLGGSCMGHVFQNFQGTGIPRAGALSNKRNKFDPLLWAVWRWSSLCLA